MSLLSFQMSEDQIYDKRFWIGLNSLSEKNNFDFSYVGVANHGG